MSYTVRCPACSRDLRAASLPFRARCQCGALVLSWESWVGEYDDPASLPASRDEAAQEEADEQRRDVYAGRER